MFQAILKTPPFCSKRVHQSAYFHQIHESLHMGKWPQDFHRQSHTIENGLWLSGWISKYFTLLIIFTNFLQNSEMYIWHEIKTKNIIWEVTLQTEKEMWSTLDFWWVVVNLFVLFLKFRISYFSADLYFVSYMWLTVNRNIEDSKPQPPIRNFCKVMNK